jgi:hypothetical protein
MMITDTIPAASNLPANIARLLLFLVHLLLFALPSYAEMIGAANVSPTVVDIRSFGATCNARYFNPGTNDWYVDPAFTTLAADDTAGIQTAVHSVKAQKSTPRIDPFHASFNVAKIIRFPAGQRCRITSPVLIEADAESTTATVMDNIVVEGYGSQLVASGRFTGVSRYYDTKHTETIKAMLLMGTKNFGKDLRSDYQSYNKILGLQFIGNGDQDLAAVYIDAGSGYQIQDLHFERLGYGIKARILRHSIIANIEAIDTHSLIYSYNNTADIKSADPTSHWERGGSEGGNVTLSNIYYMTQPGTMLEANKARGALHFYNTGELKITNVTIFGGSRGIVLDGQSYTSVSGNKWNLISNVEIAETELEPLYFNAKRYMNVSNANITWCFKNTQGWASADYFAPYLNFIDVRNSIVTNIIIDRDNADNRYKGGHDIKLTNSICNTFSNITITGRPGSTDDKYSHFYLANSSYNQLHTISAIDVDAAIRWKYGLFADATSDHNQLNDATLRLIKTAGNELFFNRNSTTTRNVTFD